MLSLPARVTVVDVAARDGLQSFHRWVDTDDKVRMIDRLSAAGLPVIEVTGMARAEVVPNLRDAEEVLARIRHRPGTTYRVLVPNARGAQRAVACRPVPDELLGLIVASERYLWKNQRMTLAQASAEVIRSFHIAREAGLSFVVAIGGAMWDIYEGPIPAQRVLDLLAVFHAEGIRRIYLGGSLGVEDPVQVGRLFGAARARWPDLILGYHVHNLTGIAAANVVAALDAGAVFIEGAIAGLGGGIAMPGTIDGLGNYATEDLVHLLDAMGVDTGLDVDEVIAASRDIARLLGISPAGHLARCGSRRELLQGRPS